MPARADELMLNPKGEAVCGSALGVTRDECKLLSLITN